MVIDLLPRRASPNARLCNAKRYRIAVDATSY